MDESPRPDHRYLEFFEILDPIEVPLWYRGAERMLKFHILEAREEVWLITQRDTKPENTRLMYEGCLRAAMALVAVDGRPCDMGLDQKLAWVQTWPGPLLDAILLRYDLATQIPLLELQKMLEDPNFAAAPFGSGPWPEGADFSTANDFPLTAGPSPLSTLLRT